MKGESQHFIKSDIVIDTVYMNGAVIKVTGYLNSDDTVRKCSCITHNSNEYLFQYVTDSLGNVIEAKESILYITNSSAYNVNDTINVKFYFFINNNLRIIKVGHAERVFPDTSRFFYSKSIKNSDKKCGEYEFVPDKPGKYKVRIGGVSISSNITISDCHFYIDVLN